MAEKRTIHTGRDHFEQVGRDVYTGPVYTGTVIVQRNWREICVPLQLPPRAEHFTGREHDLAQLLQNLQPGRVVTLCGPSGSRSHLAAHPGQNSPGVVPGWRDLAQLLHRATSRFSLRKHRPGIWRRTASHTA